MTEQNPEPARVRVTDPGGILSVVPLLLGYEPADGDLVTLGISGEGRILVAARMQAAEIDQDSAGQLRQVFGNFRHIAGAESAIVIGYGTGEMVTPAVDRLVPVAAESLDIRDALRVEGNRYWSYGCTDLECCPAEGRQFSRETTASTTLRAQAGLDAAPSRDAIAARIAGPAQQSARQARDPAASQRVSMQAGRRQVRQALQSSYAGGQLSDDDAARLATAVRALPVRDDAWARMTPERSAEHVAFWSDVVRRVPDEAVAGPASMLAFCAWQAGNGALAQIALDRAQAAQPDYSLASLLRQAVSAGLPPGAAVPPMTPAEVEQSYRELDARPKAEPPGLGERQTARERADAPGTARPYGEPGLSQAGKAAEPHDGLCPEPDREAG